LTDVTPAGVTPAYTQADFDDFARLWKLIPGGIVTKDMVDAMFDPDAKVIEDFHKLDFKKVLIG
jgi:hypothetical protein